MGGGGADVELAPAGARHRAARVGPGAGTDDRRVTDPAPALVGHAAGGGAGGQVAFAVQCQRTDRAEIGLARQLRCRIRGGLCLGLRFQCLLQLLPALFGAEPGRIDQFHALFGGEGLGAGADHHHVPGAVHHRASQLDRVPDPAHASHRPGLAAGTVHDRGVQLIAPIVGEHRAAPGVELWRILEHGHRGGDRVQRGLARLQLRMASAQRLLQRGARGRLVLGRQVRPFHSGTAMDHQQGVLHRHQHAVAHRVGALEQRLLHDTGRQMQGRAGAHAHHLHPRHAHRLVLFLRGQQAAAHHRHAGTGSGGVDPGAAVAFHRQRRVLVHAQAEQGAAVGQGLGLGHEGHQAAETTAFAEVGVGDHPAQQVQAQEIAFDGVVRAQRVGQGTGAVEAAAVHRGVQVLAQHRQPGAGAAQRLAGPHVGFQRRGHRGTAPVAHVAGLVATGDEDAVGAFQRLEDLRVVGCFAVTEHEGLGRLDAADFVEELVADLAALGGAQDDDVAVPGLVHEPAQGVVVAVAATHQQQPGLDRAGGGQGGVADKVVTVVGRRGRCRQRKPDRQACRPPPSEVAPHPPTPANVLAAMRRSQRLDDPGRSWPPTIGGGMGRS